MVDCQDVKLNSNYSLISILDLALSFGNAFFSFATTKRKETKEKSPLHENC